MVGVSTFKPRLDKTLKGDYEQTDLDPDNWFALQWKFGLWQWLNNTLECDAFKT